MKEGIMNFGNNNSVQEGDVVVISNKDRFKPRTAAYHTGLKQHVTVDASYHNESCGKVLYDVTTIEEPIQKVEKVFSQYLELPQPSYRKLCAAAKPV